MDNQTQHVSVRMPCELARWLRVEAALRDISRSDLIRRIVVRQRAADQADSDLGRTDLEAANG